MTLERDEMSHARGARRVSKASSGLASEAPKQRSETLNLTEVSGGMDEWTFVAIVRFYLFFFIAANFIQNKRIAKATRLLRACPAPQNLRRCAHLASVRWDASSL